MAMDPVITGSLITAGAGLAGGMLGRSDNLQALHQQLAMHKADQELQHAFATQGVRWRVADAQAAGVHPLFALGAQLPSGSPSGTGVVAMGESRSERLGRSLAEAGQHVGRAVAAQETADQRALRLAQLDVLSAQAGKDRAIAGYYDSEKARNMMPAPPFPNMGDASGYVSDLPGQSSSIVHQGVNPNFGGVASPR